ncbi:MAG TPA: hypothetical protein VK184_11360 [Nostocaceae cyanobacterium]|nr:hypothetical protein [Nostocaceae cyanobacterium]
MGNFPESENPRKKAYSVPVPPELRQRLREAFEQRYKPSGTKKARMGDFRAHWDLELDIDSPNPQTVRNFLDAKNDSAEHWLINGLCILLIECSYDDWKKLSKQNQETSLEPVKSPVSNSGFIASAPYLGEGEKDNYTIALSRQLAAQSGLLADQSKLKSLLLAIESVKRYHCVETDHALRKGIAKLACPLATMNYGSNSSIVNAISFSPDGKYLGAAYNDNTAQIWKWETNSHQPCHIIKHKKQVVLDKDVDEEYLKVSKIFLAKDYFITIAHESYYKGAYLSEYSTISIFDLIDETNIINQTIGKIIDCKFLPNSECLLTLLYSPNVTILWKFINGSLQPVNIVEHSKKTIACALNPHNLKLEISDEIQEKTWQRRSGEGAKYILQKYVPIISFSPDGKYLAKVSEEHYTRDSLIEIAVVSNGHIISSISPKYLVWAISFSRDGRYLAIAGRSRIAHVYEVNTGKEFFCIPHEDFVYDIVFSPTDNGRYLLATASNVAQVWELDHAPQVALITHRAEKIPVKENEFPGAVFSSDSKYIATADDDGSLKVWATANSQLIVCLKYDSFVRIFAFSPDSKYMATVSKDNTLSIKNWQDSGNHELMRINYKEFIRTIIFSPDGKYLALLIAAPENRRYWEVRVLRLNLNLSDLQLSQNSNYSVWEELHRQEFRTIQCAGNNDIKFSWDGKDLYLLTADSSGTAEIWNVVTGDKIAQVKHENSEPT